MFLVSQRIPRGVDASIQISQRRGNFLYTIDDVRHRALAVRRRRATPGGVFAVRARGAYVFYCVEEIPRGVDASIQISQRRGNFLYTIDNVRHRTLAVRRRSAIGRKERRFQRGEGNRSERFPSFL